MDGLDGCENFKIKVVQCIKKTSTKTSIVLVNFTNTIDVFVDVFLMQQNQLFCRNRRQNNVFLVRHFDKSFRLMCVLLVTLLLLRELVLDVSRVSACRSVLSTPLRRRQSKVHWSHAVSLHRSQPGLSGTTDPPSPIIRRTQNASL